MTWREYTERRRTRAGDSSLDEGARHEKRPLEWSCQHNVPAADRHTGVPPQQLPSAAVRFRELCPYRVAYRQGVRAVLSAICQCLTHLLNDLGLMRTLHNYSCVSIEAAVAVCRMISTSV